MVQADEICEQHDGWFRLTRFVSNMTEATVESLRRWLEGDSRLYQHFTNIHRLELAQNSVFLKDSTEEQNGPIIKMLKKIFSQ